MEMFKVAVRCLALEMATEVMAAGAAITEVGDIVTRQVTK
jgi:hypothetical protein